MTSEVLGFFGGFPPPPPSESVADICWNFSSEDPPPKKKKKKVWKFPGSRRIIRKKAGKSKTGLPYNDVFTETWKAEIRIGYQRETNVCCWNIWVSFILMNMALQSIHLKIGMDTFDVSLGFEVKKLFPRYSVAVLSWEHDSWDQTFYFWNELFKMYYILYGKFYVHAQVCVHWNPLEFWGGKSYDDVLKETQQFPGIQSWSVIHNAYQT